MPPSLPDAALGSGTAGVWTAAQARACGLSEGAIARRVASGQWQRLHRGVLTYGGVEPSPLMRGWAAVLARGGPGRAWATGRTLARMLGLPLIDDEDPATGACDGVNDDVALRTGHPGRTGTLHATRPRLVRGRDTLRLGGCPVVRLDVALPGMAAVLAPDALVCLLDAALHRELLTREDLELAVARAHGHRQACTLRRAALLADGRAESPAETLARLLLLPVLPGLVPQVRLRDGRGQVVARFDLADRGRRFAVEADGRRGHAGDAMVAKDRRRDRTSRSLGWATERCTWYDLRRRQVETVRRVLAAAAEHAARRHG